MGFAFALVGGRGASGDGPAGGLGDVIDRSIGRHIIRRLSGRSSDPAAEESLPTVALTADQVAYRIGTPGAADPDRDEAAVAGLGGMAAAGVAADGRTASATGSAPARSGHDRRSDGGDPAAPTPSRFGCCAHGVVGTGPRRDRRLPEHRWARAVQDVPVRLACARHTDLVADRRSVAGARRDAGPDRRAGRDSAADGCPARYSDGSRADDASDAKADRQADAATHADPDASSHPQEIDAKADRDPNAATGCADRRGSFVRCCRRAAPVRRSVDARRDVRLGLP